MKLHTPWLSRYWVAWLLRDIPDLLQRTVLGSRQASLAWMSAESSFSFEECLRA